MAPYDPEDLRHALQYMVRSIRHGGAIASAEFRQTDTFSEEKPGEGVVTATDRVIDSLLKTAILSRNRPNEGLVAEEARRSLNWVIDAIDGSRNYAEGVPTFVHMLSLNNQAGQPILGITHDSRAGDMYTAIVGQGTHLNSAPVSVNSNKRVAGSRIVVPSEAYKRRMDVGGLLNALIKADVEIITSGSFGHDGVRLLTGNVTGLIYPYISPWDISALKIQAEEAKRPDDGEGGKATSLTGDEQDYTRPIDGAVVTNGLIHDELLEIVGRFLVWA